MNNNLGNHSDDEGMPDLTDSDTEIATPPQPTAEVQTTVVPTVIANVQPSVEIERSNFDVEFIKETAEWVQWFLEHQHRLGEQLSGTHRQNATQFINDLCAQKFKK